jgi:hypothetical protein
MTQGRQAVVEFADVMERIQSEIEGQNTQWAGAKAQLLKMDPDVRFAMPEERTSSAVAPPPPLHGIRA